MADTIMIIVMIVNKRQYNIGNEQPLNPAGGYWFKICRWI